MGIPAVIWAKGGWGQVLPLPGGTAPCWAGTTMPEGLPSPLEVNMGGHWGLSVCPGPNFPLQGRQGSRGIFDTAVLISSL